jgi:hypothetical protein
MITVHATKKLFAKLPVDEQGYLPAHERTATANHLAANDEGASLLSGWHGNLVTLQRRNCVLFVHDTTRFTLLLMGLTKPDFAKLDFLFQDALMNTLLKCGANDEQMRAVVMQLQDLCFDTQCDRSVQGSLNRMKSDIEHLLWYDNADIMALSAYRTSVWLSNRPSVLKGMKSNECLWPIKAMAALVGKGEFNTPSLFDEPL